MNLFIWPSMYFSLNPINGFMIIWSMEPCMGLVMVQKYLFLLIKVVVVMIVTKCQAFQHWRSTLTVWHSIISWDDTPVNWCQNNNIEQLPLWKVQNIILAEIGIYSGYKLDFQELNDFCWNNPYRLSYCY